jgi:transcriptional regulator with XRE-family HTH domain
MLDPLGTIREQVRKLLQSRPDVKQQDFGKAIGRGPSWVSRFLAGERDANETILVARIARFFGVTVGYLLNETDRRRDAATMMLLAAWERLDSKDREATLQLALTLRPRDEPGGAAPAEAPDGPLPTTRRSRQRASTTPKRTPRRRPGA